MIGLLTAYRSETGHRPRNEDSCGYWTSDKGCCWVVSDGAGGHGGGDKASQMVVGTTLELFSSAPEVSDQEVVRLLEGAHHAVVAAKRANPKGDDMHATAAVLLIDAALQAAVWGHVGDTRIYLFRQHRMLHRTRDHSLVQNMIDAGYGTADMIRGHPQRSLLTSAIGNSGELAISVSGTPTAVELGDTFFICSDGWWEYVEEHEMEALLDSATSLEGWLASMADLVVQRAGEYSDNYTAIVVQAADPDSVTTVIRASD